MQSLQILQSSQENNCAGVPYLIKLQAMFNLRFRCFIVKFAKFLRTLFKKRTPLCNCFWVECKYDNTKTIRITSYPISSSLSSKYCSLLLLKTTFTLFSNFLFFNFFHFLIFLVVMFTNSYRMTCVFPFLYWYL